MIFPPASLLISTSDASLTPPGPPSDGTTLVLMDQRDIKSDPGSQTLPHSKKEKIGKTKPRWQRSPLSGGELRATRSASIPPHTQP